MKAFDLDLYNQLVKEGKTPKIVTRAGCDVRILCTDRKYEGETIVALMNAKGREGIRTYYPCGRYLGEGEHENDLFFADIEPAYRPYKDAEECFKDVVKHGGWVKKKHAKSYYHVIRIDGDGVCYAEDACESFQDMLIANVWADDGQPCGKLIDE